MANIYLKALKHSIRRTYINYTYYGIHKYLGRSIDIEKFNTKLIKNN
jgi:hypothetical protein